MPLRNIFVLLLARLLCPWMAAGAYKSYHRARQRSSFLVRVPRATMPSSVQAKLLPLLLLVQLATANILPRTVSAFAGETSTFAFPPSGATVTATDTVNFPDGSQVGFPGPTPSAPSLSLSLSRVLIRLADAPPPMQPATRPTRSRPRPRSPRSTPRSRSSTPRRPASRRRRSRSATTGATSRRSSRSTRPCTASPTRRP
jgi:hypothetical protein